MGKASYNWGTLDLDSSVEGMGSDQRLYPNSLEGLGTFSSPDCIDDPFDPFLTLVAIGYSLGTIRVYRYDAYDPNREWGVVQEILPNNYNYGALTGGFANPRFTDFDQDYIMDGMVVGFQNGQGVFFSSSYICLIS
jgi:hypothetical protein